MYRKGDKVYFVSNGLTVTEATVTGFAGGMYSLRYKGNSYAELAGIRLRESRLYPTKDAAEAAIKPPKTRR